MQIQDMNKYDSVTLSRAMPTRVMFNPKNKKHRESVKKFLETGKWGDVLFQPEYPHVEVPMTVLMKLAEYHLGIEQSRFIKKAA